MNGGGQLGGRRPEPTVLVESGFQGCSKRRRNPGNQQRQRRPLRAGLGRAAGQAVPAQRRQRIHITFRLQPGPDGVHRRRVAETLRSGVGHRHGVSGHAGHAQVGQQRFAVGGEQHIAGRDIAVGETLAVQVRECLGDRGYDGHGLPRPQAPPAGEGCSSEPPAA